MKQTKPPAHEKALHLMPIEPTKIHSGAYTIKYNGKVPQGARVWLCIANSENRLDITDRYHPEMTDQLLQATDDTGRGNSYLDAWLELWPQCPLPAYMSNVVNFKTHVKPFDAPITLANIRNEVPALTYAGDGEGRLLTDQMNGVHYFRFGGTLEFDPQRRGFDCTTFPIALLGLNIDVSSKYGDAVADALGAKKCSIEDMKRSDIGKKAKDNSTFGQGLFILWSEGHVVLMRDRTVHEFTFGGYKETDVLGWANIHQQQKWTMREINGQRV